MEDFLPLLSSYCNNFNFYSHWDAENLLLLFNLTQGTSQNHPPQHQRQQFCILSNIIFTSRYVLGDSNMAKSIGLIFPPMETKRLLTSFYRNGYV